MSDIMKETDKNDVDDILEMNDITDEELMDDLGLDLGNSLKAAFDSSKISVSEELIAATMAKIKMLEQEEKKESDADTDTEINGTDAGIMLNGKATETKTAGEHG
ncbi:MAG: hypothetical protein J6Y89_02485, partial [Lachnospiraceae bacterium]|nr:hypothetical protein [Lachnospiraceae bacterium]